MATASSSQASTASQNPNPLVADARDRGAWDLIVSGRAVTSGRNPNSFTEAEGALMAEEHADALDAITDPERRGFASAHILAIANRQGQYRRALLKNHQAVAAEVSGEARYVVRSYDKERHNQVLDFTDDTDRAIQSYVIASSPDFGARRGAGANVSLVDAQGELSASREAEGPGVYRVRFATDAGREAIEAAAVDMTARKTPTPTSSAEWCAIESVPGAQMRANSEIRMVEVARGGQMHSLSGIAAIEAWAEKNDASLIDKERLIALDVEASRQTAPSHSITKETENMETANTPASNATDPKAERIGRLMPTPDFLVARTELQARSGGQAVRLFQPKAHGEYGGQVLFISDTHIVQRVGPTSGVLHDLKTLENGAQLDADIEARKIPNGTHMRFVYGEKAGVGEVVPYNQKIAEQVQKQLKGWAEENLSNVRSREVFLKHLENATKDLSKPRPEAAQQQQREKPVHQPTPQRAAPQRTR